MQTDPVPDAPAVVTLRDLQVGYNNDVILHDVSARILQGETVAVTGNNGSGKSTLIKALIGTVAVQGGSIDLLGYVRQAHARPTGPLPWGRVGYVPQRLAAAGGVESTVTEVVQTGLLGKGRKMWLQRGSRQKVEESLDAVGLRHRKDDSFQVLSGGQQQRVLIARALVRDPSLLLLDEPLTGLDAHNRQRLADIVSARQEAGGTAIIVLHELAEFRPLITREIRIHSGHIVHDGPCDHGSHYDPHGPYSASHLGQETHGQIGQTVGVEGPI